MRGRGRRRRGQSEKKELTKEGQLPATLPIFLHPKIGIYWAIFGVKNLGGFGEKKAKSRCVDFFFFFFFGGENCYCVCVCFVSGFVCDEKIKEVFFF